MLIFVGKHIEIINIGNFIDNTMVVIKLCQLRMINALMWKMEAVMMVLI